MLVAPSISLRCATVTNINTSKQQHSDTSDEFVGTMGNEASSALIRKCSVPSKEAYSTDHWLMYEATLGDNQHYSLFVFHHVDNFHDVTRWKHLRHPNLVKCYETGELRGKRYFLTEPVIPLEGCDDETHPLLRLAGLYEIGEALSFLHNVCQMSVNNLSRGSIFISKNDVNKAWKLGSLYWYSSIDTEGEEFFKKLLTYHTAHNNLLSAMPPEDRELATHRLIRSKKDIHHRDVYAFASLLESLVYDSRKPPTLSQLILADEDQESMVNGTSAEVTELNHRIKLMIDDVHKQPADTRPTMDTLLAHNIFKQCEFLQLRKCLLSFSTLDEMDKLHFLESVIERLKRLPHEMLIINVFRIIVSSRVTMSDPYIYHNVMPYFLIPKKSSPPSADVAACEESYTLCNGESISLCPLISCWHYTSYIIPHLDTLFCVHDLAIRKLLLLYLPHFGTLIDKSTLRKRIMPQILLGMKDSNTELVSLTFRALACLVEQHGVVNVLGGTQRSVYFKNRTTRDPRVLGDTNSLDNVSLISDKSMQSNNSYTMGDNLKSLFTTERTSPDGDEEKKRNSGVALNLVDDDDGEGWSEWDTQASKIETPKAVGSHHNKAKPNATFDIKEIDFKDYAADNQELSNLFMELEPVLRFQTKKAEDSMLKGAANKTNEKTEIDLGRFVAKLDTNEMEGENAWDDDDDNLDLEDHPQDTEPTRPVQLQINSIGVNDKLEKLAVNEEELSSDAEMNCSSTIASEYASPLSTTPTSFKDEIDC